MASPSTTVRHITKDHVVITPAKGYSVVLFTIGKVGGDIEALVVSDDGAETIRLLVAGPHADQTMAIRTSDDGTVSIMYARKSDVR
jgi:hypothetical protein